jgi:hypothetical protein
MKIFIFIIVLCCVICVWSARPQIPITPRLRRTDVDDTLSDIRTSRIVREPTSADHREYSRLVGRQQSSELLEQASSNQIQIPIYAAAHQPQDESGLRRNFMVGTSRWEDNDDDSNMEDVFEENPWESPVRGRSPIRNLSPIGSRRISRERSRTPLQRSRSPSPFAVTWNDANEASSSRPSPQNPIDPRSNIPMRSRSSSPNRNVWDDRSLVFPPSNPNNPQDVIMGGQDAPLLPPRNHELSLYTRKRDGTYVPILKKNGKMTRQYQGGIYVHKGDRIVNVHKMMQMGYVNSNGDLPPNLPPAAKNKRLGQLLTITRDNRYIPILTERDDITMRYRGGIYVGDGTRFEPVHKRMEKNWVRRNRRRRY